MLIEDANDAMDKTVPGHPGEALRGPGSTVGAVSDPGQGYPLGVSAAVAGWSADATARQVSDIGLLRAAYRPRAECGTDVTRTGTAASPH